MANQASMNLLMQSFGMFGNAMTQQRELALQKRRQSLIEKQFMLEQEQAQSQAQAFENASSIMQSMEGSPGQASLQGPGGAPVSLDTIDATPLTQEPPPGLSDEEINRKMLLAGQQLVKAGYGKEGLELMGKGMPKTQYQRDMDKLRKQMEYYKTRREGLGMQTDETNLQYLPQEKETDLAGKQATTGKVLQDTEFAAQNQPGRLQAQDLSNAATQQAMNIQANMSPVELEQRRLAVEAARMNNQQNATLYPIQAAQANQNLALGAQTYDYNQAANPYKVQDIQAGVGAKNASTDAILQNTAENAALFPTKVAQNKANVAQTYATTGRLNQQALQDAELHPIRVDKANADVESTQTGTAAVQQGMDFDRERQPGVLAQQGATLDATQTGTAAVQQGMDFNKQRQPGVLAQQDAALEATRVTTQGQRQEQLYKQADRPTQVQNKILDLHAKEQDAKHKELTHNHLAYQIEREVRKDKAGDDLVKTFLADAGADPKNKTKGRVAQLASVGRFGEAIALSMPQTGTQMVDYLMRDKGMGFQEAMGEYKRWENKKINPQLFGADTEERALTMFDKSYGELTQTERQKLADEDLRERVRLKMAESPQLNEKVALIDTQVEQAAKLLVGDATTLYVGPGRGRKGQLWQWAGAKVPEDEAKLHQNIALIRNAYIHENSGAGTSAEEIRRNFDATFDVTQHPDVFKTRVTNWMQFQLGKRENLVAGAVTSQAPTMPGAAPAQAAQAPNIIGRTPEGRPMVKNEDGSVSTERTITIQHPKINGGKPTNIPSMYDGIQRSEEQAVNIIIESGGKDPETGRALQGYNSIDEAVKAAQERSEGLPTSPQSTQQGQTEAPKVQLPAGFQSMSPEGQKQILQMLTPEERKGLGMP